jgi:hypothetical protein
MESFNVEMDQYRQQPQVQWRRDKAQEIKPTQGTRQKRTLRNMLMKDGTKKMRRQQLSFTCVLTTEYIHS